MLRSTIKFALATVLVAGTASSALHAAILFDTGAGTATTLRPQAGNINGIGQGVSVSTTTTLTNIAMDIAPQDGGNIKYMIWDSTDTTLLFSETQAVVASSTLSFVQSTAFSFQLLAGNSYFFGVISDTATDGHFVVSLFNPAITHTENGLTNLGATSNYSNFASPAPTSGGLVTVALQLSGTQGAVPEPSTFAMIGIAFVLVAGRRLYRAGRRTTIV